jgi:hypothetical protein
VWRSGLRFEDFASSVLDLTMSKASIAAVFDVTAGG